MENLHSQTSGAIKLSEDMAIVNFDNGFLVAYEKLARDNLVHYAVLPCGYNVSIKDVGYGCVHDILNERSCSFSNLASHQINKFLESHHK